MKPAMTRGSRALVAIAASMFLLVPGPPVAGQSRTTDPRLLMSAAPAPQARGTDPGKAFLASALLPGAGQYMLGADRWVPYAVLEVWAWVTHLDRRSRARLLTRQYRDLARSVPRRPSIGERRDTVFEYYEAMSRFAASGSFDSDPRRAGVQPEGDATTFNGDLWQLSRSLFFPGGNAYPEGSPQYGQALAYYERRAIPPSFAWAWGDSFLEQRTYGELIRGSDEASRSATHLLGVILANHMVSAIDALVLGRVEESTAGAISAHIGGAMDGTGDPRWTLTIRLGW
jgi:hypothetical protein